MQQPSPSGLAALAVAEPHAGRNKRAADGGSDWVGVDFTCFVALGVSAEIGRSQFGVRSVSQPVATMVAVINQLLASSIGDSRN